MREVFSIIPLSQTDDIEDVICVKGKSIKPQTTYDTPQLCIYLRIAHTKLIEMTNKKSMFQSFHRSFS